MAHGCSGKLDRPRVTDKMTRRLMRANKAWVKSRMTPALVKEYFGDMMKLARAWGKAKKGNTKELEKLIGKAEAARAKAGAASAKKPVKKMKGKVSK